MDNDGKILNLVCLKRFVLKISNIRIYNKNKKCLSYKKKLEQFKFGITKEFNNDFKCFG